MEERKAIERLKRGDVDGLQMLAELHYTHAARTAYLIVRDRTLAEDVVQGALVRAYDSIGSFDDRRPFRPWFIKIVINDAIKMASRQERTASFYEGDTENLLGSLADPETSPHELAEEADTSQRVWRALEQLPPTQRAVVVQRYYLGMSEAEMTRNGKVPPGTVKSRLNRARRSLSKLLRPEFRAQTAPPLHERLAHVSAHPNSFGRKKHHD